MEAVGSAPVPVRTVSFSLPRVGASEICTIVDQNQEVLVTEEKSNKISKTSEQKSSKRTLNGVHFPSVNERIKSVDVQHTSSRTDPTIRHSTAISKSSPGSVLLHPGSPHTTGNRYTLRRSRTLMSSDISLDQPYVPPGKVLVKTKSFFIQTPGDLSKLKASANHHPSSSTTSTNTLRKSDYRNTRENSSHIVPQGQRHGTSDGSEWDAYDTEPHLFTIQFRDPEEGSEIDPNSEMRSDYYTLTRLSTHSNEHSPPGSGVNQPLHPSVSQQCVPRCKRDDRMFGVLKGTSKTLHNREMDDSFSDNSWWRTCMIKS